MVNKKSHTLILFLMMLLNGIIACGDDATTADSGLDYIIATATDGPVTIEERPYYYLVTIDMRQVPGSYTHTQIGQAYGRAVMSIFPSFERRAASFIAELTWGVFHELPITKTGNLMNNRVNPIKTNVPQNYRDEIDGMISVMPTDWFNTLAYTPTEILYLYNLMPDVFRPTQCSAYGVTGDTAAKGTPIAWRTLDWYGGLFNELPPMQAVTKFVYADKKIITFGALGHLGCVTGINTATGIMGAILDADVNAAVYPDPVPAGFNSYNFDLRYALETKATSDEIAAAMADPNYTYSHLIFLADASGIKVLENNVSKMGYPATATGGSRAVRTSTSTLNPGLAWSSWPNLMGVVNCFMLNGQYNNMGLGPLRDINYKRWLLMTQETATRMAAGNNKLDENAVMGIMTSYSGDHPGSLMDGDGDIYNQETQQMMLYLPAEKSLKVFFKPKDGSTPDNPSKYFISISLD